MSERFRIVVPILTPYHADGSVDDDALHAHAAALASAGVDGFFVAGTNGEGPLLSDDEVVRATAAVRAGAPEQEIIVQAGRNGTTASRRLLERVVAGGADAIAVMTPAFYELSAEHALAHFTALIEAAGDVPLLAYVIPAYARNDLSPETARRLAARGMAGVKDSTKSEERHRSYVAIAAEAPPRGFRTFVGADGLTLGAFTMGSSGAVPALANVRPELFAQLVEAAEAGEETRAAELQREIDFARRALRGRGIGTLKHAVAQMMGARGVAYASHVRAPLLPHDETARAV